MSPRLRGVRKSVVGKNQAAAVEINRVADARRRGSSTAAMRYPTSTMGSSRMLDRRPGPEPGPRRHSHGDNEGRTHAAPVFASAIFYLRRNFRCPAVKLPTKITVLPATLPFRGAQGHATSTPRVRRQETQAKYGGTSPYSAQQPRSIAPSPSLSSRNACGQGGKAARRAGRSGSLSTNGFVQE